MKKLIILDHFLNDNKGHDEQYDFSIAREAIRRGIVAEVWSPKRKDPQPEFVKQYLKTPFWKRANALGKIFAALGSIFEWRTLFMSEKLDNNSIVLIQTIKFPILVFLSLGLVGISVKPKLAIVLRRGIENSIARTLMKYLNNRKNTVFLPDSELITEELLGEGFQNAKTLPIPHLPAREALEKENRRVIGYFGEARYDKGFDLLPGLIENVLKDDQSASFIIQSNVHKRTAAMADAVGRLFNIGDSFPSRLEIIDRYVSDAEYAALMRKCSIILIPYRGKLYGKGTSGILAEAIACGKWAVVPAGTWMADQKKKYPKIAIFNAATVESIANAIKACEGNFLGLEQKIDEWYKFHSAENYLNILSSV
jgi:glycosyltransferase involved in cell wall biosynthesis